MNMHIFLLMHIFESSDGVRDHRIIGAYSSREDAERSAEKLKKQPGFVENPDGFTTLSYELGKDHWAKGMVSWSSEEALDFEMACSELVIQTAHMNTLSYLFARESGRWFRLSELLAKNDWIGTDDGYREASIIWLPAPEGDAGYALVLIRRNDTGHSFTATYNTNVLPRYEVH